MYPPRRCGYSTQRCNGRVDWLVATPRTKAGLDCGESAQHSIILAKRLQPNSRNCFLWPDWSAERYCDCGANRSGNFSSGIPARMFCFRFLGADTIDCSGRSWQEQIRTHVPETQQRRVQFEQLARPDLRDRYKKAYVCVLPSLWENFPYGLLEAMACGIPVVATTVGGLPELIDHGGSGLLVPPNDPEALATAVCRLLDDPSLKKRDGAKRASAFETQFSTQRVLPEMLRVYRSVVHVDR